MPIVDLQNRMFTESHAGVADNAVVNMNGQIDGAHPGARRRSSSSMPSRTVLVAMKENGAVMRSCS